MNQDLIIKLFTNECMKRCLLFTVLAFHQNNNKRSLIKIIPRKFQPNLNLSPPFRKKDDTNQALYCLSGKFQKSNLRMRSKDLLHLKSKVPHFSASYQTTKVVVGD